MITHNYVPKRFYIGHSVSIYKGKGSHNDLKNWYPITIFNVLRRIIEKSFDHEMRNLV